MKSQGWFQKDAAPLRRPRGLRPIEALPLPERAGLAAKLRPHELIAMLTHHYARARARALPKVTTTLAVRSPGGRQAVTIEWP